MDGLSKASHIQLFIATFSASPPSEFVIQFRDRDRLNVLDRNDEADAPPDDRFFGIVIRDSQFKLDIAAPLHADQIPDKSMDKGVFIGIKDDLRIFVIDEGIALLRNVRRRLFVGDSVVIFLICFGCQRIFSWGISRFIGRIAVDEFAIDRDRDAMPRRGHLNILVQHLDILQPHLF